MATTQDLQLVGLDDVLANVNDLSKRVVSKINKEALIAAFTPVEDAARAKCPVGKGPEAGLLKRSLGTVVKRKKGIDLAVVGPRRGFKVPAYVATKGKHKGKVTYKIATRYGHLVEFGTSRSKAQPFMRPAWDTEGGEKALQRYINKLDAGIREATDRMRKRRK